MPTLSLSTYIKIAVAAAFALLLLYCNHLENKVSDLTKTNTELNLVYNQKVEALKLCSQGTEDLKKREDELTENGKVAVEQAKKEAIKDYVASHIYATKKPEQPVITPDNVKDYGGNDTMTQLKDYLASQKLINDFMDAEKHK